MKKISCIAVMALLLGGTSSTNVTDAANVEVVEVLRIAEPETINPKFDSVCLKCFEDSLSVIIASIKKKAAVIDSLSRRAQKNIRVVVANNRTIDVILNDCASPEHEAPNTEPETTNTEPETQKPKPEPQNMSIKVKKK